MDDMITPEELLEHLDGGAIVTEQKEPTEISEWSELVKQMARIADANEKLANKQTKSINGILEKMVTVLSHKKVDTQKMETLLTEIKHNTQDSEKPNYKFIMHRKSSNQLLDYVEVVQTPVTKVLN
jgi:hypothetical protein